MKCKKHGRNSQPVLQIFIILVLLQGANSAFPSPLDVKPSRALHIRALANYKGINSVIGNKGNFIMVLSIAKLGPSQVSRRELFLRGVL